MSRDRVCPSRWEATAKIGPVPRPRGERAGAKRAVGPFELLRTRLKRFAGRAGRGQGVVAFGALSARLASPAREGGRSRRPCPLWWAAGDRRQRGFESPASESGGKGTALIRATKKMFGRSEALFIGDDLDGRGGFRPALRASGIFKIRVGYSAVSQADYYLPSQRDVDPHSPAARDSGRLSRAAA